jgi:hypothetical protein
MIMPLSPGELRFKKGLQNRCFIITEVLLLSSEQKDEVCDATDYDSSNTAGNTIIQLHLKELQIKK